MEQFAIGAQERDADVISYVHSAIIQPLILLLLMSRQPLLPSSEWLPKRQQ